MMHQREASEFIETNLALILWKKLWKFYEICMITIYNMIYMNKQDLNHVNVCNRIAYNLICYKNVKLNAF